MQNLEKENFELSKKVESYEEELKQVKKRQCQLPGCDSKGNCKIPDGKWHYSLESCPKWNEVNIFV